MLISKFNKLIRNRLIWGIIAGMVGLSMVIYLGDLSILDFFATRAGCEREREVQPDTVALLDDQPIRDAEFRQARFDAYLSLCFMIGQKIDLNERVEKELRRRTWERIAALRQARALSLTTGDEEVLAAITRDEKFLAETGEFHPGRYQAFAQSILPQFGATKTDYERMVRDDLTLQKLQNTIGSSAWIAPYELDRAMATYADSFKLQYVELPESRFAASVQPSRDEIQSFFEKHTNRFEIPPKVRVQYVAFPVPPADAYTNAVTEEEIEQYYDDNRREYRIESTNETDAAETNLSESIENLRPLDEVRDEIRLQIAEAAARDAALTRARDFSYALTPDRDGRAPGFEALAAAPAWQLPVQTTAWFTLEDTLPGISAGPAFNQAAFEIELDSDEPFSDGIGGTEAAYVIRLLGRQEARVPTFDEVEAEVKPVALAYLRQAALLDEAARMRRAFLAGLKKGEPFDALAAAQKLAVSTTESFTAFTAPDDFSDLEKLNEITSRQAGDITDPLAVSNGVVLAHIAARIPAENEAKQAVYRQVLTSLSRQRARMVYAEWERSLIATNRFREFRNQIDEATEDDAPTGDDADEKASAPPAESAP